MLVFNINLERILNTNTIRIPDDLLIPSNMPNTPDTLIITQITYSREKLGMIAQFQHPKIVTAKQSIL